MADPASLDDRIAQTKADLAKLIAEQNKGETLAERIKTFATDDLMELFLEKLVELYGNHPTLDTIFQELKARRAAAKAKPAEQPQPPA